MTSENRQRRKPWLLLLSVLTVFALIGAACGSDEPTASGDDNAATDDAATDDAGDDDAMAEDDGEEDAMAEDDGEEDAMAEDDGEEDAMAEDDGGSEGVTIKVATVANGNVERMAELAPEHFTPDSGITVEFTILDEATLREVTTRDVAAGGEQFDVVTIGMYETPQFGANGWLVGLNELAASTPNYDIDDLIPAVRSGLSVDGELYSSPFYAESSFLMYRADVMEEAGLTMPDAPTWQEVADIAREIDTDEMAGICLRGKPGWGDLGAAFTTVLNTFGGTWWAANDDGSIGAAQVDQPEFAEALNFYVDLLNDAGEDDAANSSFTECLTLYQEGKVAMWYDATVAASILEADDSPVQGLNDFALAPVNVTDNSGWLWAWTFAIPVSTTDQDAAWEFISWATGPGYQELAANELDGGWAAVPPGTRQSLYDNPNYQDVPFAAATLSAILAADPLNPTVDPVPYVGVQFAAIPEFAGIATDVSQEFSAAYAGQQTVEEALAKAQAIANDAMEAAGYR